MAAPLQSQTPAGASQAASTLQPSTRGRHKHVSPPGTVEQPQACAISRRVMAAPSQSQTTCRCLVAGGKHSPSECQRQRQVRTLSPTPSRPMEQPQICTIGGRVMAAPAQSQMCQRQRRARTLSASVGASSLHRALWSSRKLDPSVGASWRLRCSQTTCTCLAAGGKHSPSDSQTK